MGRRCSGRLAPLKLNELGSRAVIDDGRSVRHARDGGHAPRQCRGRSRFDGLILFVTWLAQRDVQVDQARTDNETRRVDDVIGDGRSRVDPFNAVVSQKQIADPVNVLTGINDTSAANQCGAHRTFAQGQFVVPPFGGWRQ